MHVLNELFYKNSISSRHHYVTAHGEGASVFKPMLVCQQRHTVRTENGLNELRTSVCEANIINNTQGCLLLQTGFTCQQLSLLLLFLSISVYLFPLLCGIKWLSTQSYCCSTSLPVFLLFFLTCRSRIHWPATQSFTTTTPWDHRLHDNRPLSNSTSSKTTALHVQVKQAPLRT